MAESVYPATVDTELPAASALSADDVASPTAPAVGAFGIVFDGTTWDRQRGDSVGGTWVQGPAAHDAVGAGNPILNGGRASAAAPADVSADGDAVRAWYLRNGAMTAVLTAAGALIGGDATNGLDVDVTRLPALVAGTANIGDVDIASGPTGASALQAQGPAAHDAAVVGNPVRIGAKANTNEPTAVSADGDTVDLWADLLGRLVVVSGHPNPEAPVAVNATASGNTTVIAAPGASLSLYIQKVSVHNRDTTNRLVALQDGAGGTTRWRAELASEGGGSLIDFGDRGWKLTANTLLNVNLDAAGNVDVNVTAYYIAP